MTDFISPEKYIYRSCGKSSATTYHAPTVQHRRLELRCIRGISEKLMFFLKI